MGFRIDVQLKLTCLSTESVCILMSEGLSRFSAIYRIFSKASLVIET